ncbi:MULTISPECIES: ATP/GTP-binding protein [Thermomonospora]|uniref:ATP/GTP-binding protein n=1 Tax=Thermomonospora cellulosilytica TaxID=1411118 RepID=A0A7W3N568_9ACTN|nr:MULTISPECIES: ATP/GTP-binding protein [Thermomonospora]MBA9007683.1 hypothetical protein [Thermomonospora cellulosilytica]
MSPRKNRRRSEDARRSSGAVSFFGFEGREEGPDGEWIVRTIAPANAVKTYRCPGCDHEIAPGVGHVVAWPADRGGTDDRRHWHTPCWRSRLHRGPKIQRSRNGPRY